ncbi:MAG: hypothetical protein WBF99_04870 [Xanthobacteraceae bacterium]
MTIDWSDTTLRTLDELAATAFPSGSGVTKDTLKRRIRQGKLVAYRPGKAFLSSYADVRELIEHLQVKVVRPVLKPAFPPPERAEMERVNRELDCLLEDAIKKKKRKASGYNSKPALPTGITEADLANRALDHALEDARKRRKAREAEKRPVKRKRIR